MKKQPIFILFLVLLFVFYISISFIAANTSSSDIKIARLKYNGGGDWYSSRTALSNLIQYCNKNLNTNIAKEESVVEPGASELFNYPYIFATGHGNITFNNQEASNLRNYLMAGGFIHFCDNYGMDPFIRNAMKKVFPELAFVELPFNYPIYHQKFNFTNGLPKIHEHDGKRAQGFGLIYQGRLVCFYDYESDLGNGWEDLGTYPSDTEETREKALKMGANIIQYVFTK